MMDSMIEFSTAMLGAVATFLGSEPIIYIFALVCLVVIVKVFRLFMP